MNTRAFSPARWLTVATFAVAMAWVEAAVVYYLRTLVGRIEPYQADPLPMIGGLGSAELVREAATLVMLLAVGLLAGRAWRTRLGYAAVAFGVWDVSYYVCLKVMCGWPHSLLDWDVLFLLPLPWWGPVLAPVLVALLMIAWGTLASQCELPQRTPLPEGWTWAPNAAGIVLALYVFMADAIRVAPQGVTAIVNVLPVRFNWPLFAVALSLMAAPVLRLGWLCASEHVKRRLATKALC
ncbi:MAG: hypothetical protein NTV05_09545 [Acidobacteria bacterium]|nr:hypothetical protein [Acidobacteriota bacterium]